MKFFFSKDSSNCRSKMFQPLPKPIREFYFQPSAFNTMILIDWYWHLILSTRAFTFQNPMSTWILCVLFYSTKIFTKKKNTKTSKFWLNCLVLLKIWKDSVLLYFCIKFDIGFILLIQKSYSRKKARMVQFLYDLKICLKMKFHQGTVVITVKFETFVFYPREGKRGVGDSELSNK